MITELTTEYELVVILSVLYCFILIFLLAICVCGCRKGSPKNDLLGLDGMVKITNPDENVNHLPAIGKYIPDYSDGSIVEPDESNKRPAGGTNPHRSLPDIPIYTDGDAPGSDNGVSGDTSSDLYATVEDKCVNLGGPNRSSLPNGIHSRISGSIKQADNYARVRENPYDKVKKTENPYAKVQTDENEDNSRENSPSTPHSPTILACGSSSDPIAPPRSRRSSLQNSLIIASNTILPSSTGDIPAATAVAGRIAASQDLPYMTPPINVSQSNVASTLQQQQHFSGDSQDSSKGYTSISVREPLEHIRSQTKTLQSRKNDTDPHYATVSDDSDDNMYAAIVEPNNQIYNGSETYAQIQPITIVEIHGHSSNRNNTDETDVPELPNVNLKHVPHVHSRQASSSSCTSSVANIGSPKPEKRQANSPLPPTPAVSPDIYAKVDKNHSRENSRGSINVSRNLEDMYAKVHKNKKKHDDDEKSMNASTSEINSSFYSRSYTPDMNVLPYQKIIDTHSRQSWSSKDSFDENKHMDIYDYSSDSDIATDNRIKRRIEEHCYETLNKNDKKFGTPKKENEDSSDIGYEKIRERNWLTPEINNTVCSGPESILSNDPGYEQLNHSRISSEIDPNYEVLRPHRSSSLSGSSVGYSTIKTDNKSTLTVPNEKIEDGYSVVNKIKKERIDPGYEELNHHDDEEPNYESMPSECDNYATVQQKSTESESDPNYESVKYLDVTLSEPPYERLHDDENKESDLSEYEQMSSKQGSHSTPDYERIKEYGSKSSDNSEDRTISDNSKFSNGTDEEDKGNSVSVNIATKSISSRSSIEVDVNVVDVEEIFDNNDEHMYFQV